MKRFAFISLFLFSLGLSVFLSFTAACDKHAVSTPFPPPTATPRPVVNVSLAGSLFNPAAVTISAGSYVVWTNTDPYPHAVVSSDPTTTCVGNPTIMNNGASLTMLYPTTGTCFVHCAFHSNCGNTPCDATCEGGVMTMRVIVQ